MILCFAVVQASIINTRSEVFLITSVCEAFFVIRKFLPAIFGNFLFSSLSLINTNFKVRNS